MSQPLSRPQCAAVLDLVRSATEADGLHPLSEHVMLHLPMTVPDHDQHVLAWFRPESGASSTEILVGYAHHDPTDAVSGASGEVVVHPHYRRRGVGQALIICLESLTPDHRLRLWAHGEHPGAAALAKKFGYVGARQLWQMRRSLRNLLPDISLPAGYSVRAFVPGVDDSSWLALNAAAFANHPEQGSWTQAELQHRISEGWFDPAGFFLITGPDGSLAAFHWTKIHEHDSSTAAHDPIGEVYIVGVAPEHRGRGLGAAATNHGLHWLRSRGLREVMLYVDADNSAAVHTYEQLGFTRWDTDVQYARGRPR